MKRSVLMWLLSSGLIVAGASALVQEALGQEAVAQEAGKPSVAQQAEQLTPPATPPQAGELKNDADNASNDQFEVLMSGPIHEAFAEPNVEADAKALIVAKAPPEAIDEVPPDVHPDGENIEWIPGYWGWDESADDFVWVTGLWRQTPPDRQWVPGYWNQVEDGHQWISGFWAELNAEEIAYLPAPPQAPEAGPSTPQPGADNFWVPGQWNYDNTQYQWQAGYWAQHNPDWIWINTAYLATPQGFVCRPGYWDYQLGYRGTIFYPVRFNSGYSGNYRPNYVMNVGVNWLANLFVNPGYHHYYFGNYYGPQYQQNFRPWVNYSQRQRNYDPLYSYYQAGHQNYITQINQVHQQYEQNQQFRPAATLRAQQKREKEMGEGNASLAFNSAAIGALAVAGRQLRKADNNPALVDSQAAFQFKKLDRDATQRVAEALKPVRELQQQRRNTEKATPANGSQVNQANGSQANVGKPLRDQNAKDSKNLAKDNRAVDDPKNSGSGKPGLKTGVGKTDSGRPGTETPRDSKPPRDAGPLTLSKADPAVKLKLPKGSAGRGQVLQREQGNAQTPSRDAASAGKANEAGKGRSNAGSGGVQERRNAEPGLNRQPAGPGSPAVRPGPPRVSAPNKPPVPQGPKGAGKGGAAPKVESKTPANPKQQGKPNGARGDKKQ